ncbi:uncharacterized protein LOC114122721 isoform X2 [Aphis gossypii]|uniref:uncharacterized protein LOC114122721 isoform X2 n=1 Tax=Aphis gossypii TaxID=80765 RepID=UPI002159983A|nr:uncharacterized protein LOC114122721 isoform X2 [Aphis gossypii]
MNNVLNYEKLLKRQKVNIKIMIKEYEILSKLHKKETNQPESLLKFINTQLESINQEINNHYTFDKLNLIFNSIRNCAKHHLIGSETYAFGSRISAGTFWGQLSNDLHAQTNLVRYFAKLFGSQKYEYSQILAITASRVPIVTFFHVPSGLYCDLSFKSGLSVYNTKLIKLYLSLDERVNWIVCAVVKYWALQSCMKNRNMFKSYSLAWLVLFYLIVIHVIPPLMFLRRHADYSKSLTSDVMFIEDWDCTFCTPEKAKQIWRVPNISYFDLLFGFFNYYSDLNRLRKSVLCPIIGQVIPKSDLYNIPMKKKNSEPPSETLRKLKNNFCGSGLALQDPLDLLNNITKRIRQRKLTMFSYLCNLTMEGMKNRYLN